MLSIALHFEFLSYFSVSILLLDRISSLLTLLLFILTLELLCKDGYLLWLRFVNELVPFGLILASLKSHICYSCLLLWYTFDWVILLSFEVLGTWLLILLRIFDYVFCSKNLLLYEDPRFLDPATDFLFFSSSKSEWMRLSNLGSVKSEFSWLEPNLKLVFLGDWHLLLRGDVCSLWFYLKLYCCYYVLDLLSSTKSF